MSGNADDASQLKAQLRSLMDRRAALEREIAVRSARLEAAGVGMEASLVDAQVPISAAAGAGVSAARALIASIAPAAHSVDLMALYAPNPCRATPELMWTWQPSVPTATKS